MQTSLSSSPSAHQPHSRRHFLQTSITALVATALLTQESAALHTEEIKTPEQLEKEVAAHINLETGELHAEVGPDSLDIIGSLVFAWGISSLLRGGHITAKHYAALAAVLGMKYTLGDEHTRHHLYEEFKATVQAFGIISSTMVVADGIKGTIDESILSGKHSPETIQQKLASVSSIMASLLSPLVTTVGSSTILNQPLTLIADTITDPIKKKQFQAASVSHVANQSGFLLFGDPPFIAMMEKFGFEEAINFQLASCWPLYIGSLLNASTQMYKALDVPNPAKQAVEDIITLAPTIAQIAGKSLKNIAKTFGQKPQDEKGVQLYLVNAITKMVQGTRIHITPPKPLRKGTGSTLSESEMRKRDYLLELANIERFKHNLGHNLGDVVNVFPFQALSVPFLTPIFQKLIDVVRSSLPQAKSPVETSAIEKMIIFSLVAAFSSMADNYVACKIGLELLPGNPEVPLIASIYGGSLTAVGNMANIALFDLEKYSLPDSIGQIRSHLPIGIVNMIWATSYEALGKQLSMFPRGPQPKK